MHALLVDLARRAPVRFEVIAVNIDQGHPGYPGHLLTRLHGGGRPRVPDDRGGHVLDRHRQDPRGEDVLLALLAPPPRHPLPRRARARLHQDRARPPPRRRGHHPDAQPGLRRPAQGDAAQADLGRRATTWSIRPLDLLRRGRPRGLRRASEAFPIIPCDLCGSQENLQRKADLAPARRARRALPRRPAQHAGRARQRPAEPPLRQGALEEARARGGARRGEGGDAGGLVRRRRAWSGARRRHGGGVGRGDRRRGRAGTQAPPDARRLPPRGEPTGALARAGAARGARAADPRGGAGRLGGDAGAGGLRAWRVLARDGALPAARWAPGSAGPCSPAAARRAPAWRATSGSRSSRRSPRRPGSSAAYAIHPLRLDPIRGVLRRRRLGGVRALLERALERRARAPSPPTPTRRCSCRGRRCRRCDRASRRSGVAFALRYLALAFRVARPRPRAGRAGRRARLRRWRWSRRRASSRPRAASAAARRAGG